MEIVDRWLLPEGVEDVLPPQANRTEEVRRRLLDLYSTWGYEYVIPPIVEYLESLLTGTGHDLDLKTLKVTDLKSGRTMGLRADITPQVARIDAHSLNKSGVVRLCYAGTVVHSQPDGLLESRTPLSVGAELFGDSSNRGDIEIVSLMIESLRALGLKGVKIDLGDVAIYRQLVESLGLTSHEQEQVFAAVQKKSPREIAGLLEAFGVETTKSDLLGALPGLMGDGLMLEGARQIFNDYPGIIECIDNLQRVAEAVQDRFEDIQIYFDLSELRGYEYHTGIVFSAYVDGLRHGVAKGGRYDHIGEVFGRVARGATGFSINVRNIASEEIIETHTRPSVVVAEGNDEDQAGLWHEMNRLRKEGYAVLETGEPSGHELLLIRKADKWVLTQRED